MYENIFEVSSYVKSLGGDKEFRLAELKKIEAGLVKESERLAVHNLPYMHVEDLLKEIVAQEDWIVTESSSTREISPVAEETISEPTPEIVAEPISEIAVEPEIVAEPISEVAVEPAVVTPKVRKPRAKKVVT